LREKSFAGFKVSQSPKILGIILARGGSKGLPKKNIRLLGGKPLIAWTIEAAQKSQWLSRLILSTDDDEIIDAAKKWKCEVPFKRPAHLALDETPSLDPMLHALEKVPGYDYVVLLQPTTPLRTAADIDGCINLCFEKKANSCISVVQPAKSPYWMFSRDKESAKLSPLMQEKILRRQDLPQVFAINGAVYVNKVPWLKEKKSFIDEETIGFEMPASRSIDIDTELDFSMANFLISQGDF